MVFPHPLTWEESVKLLLDGTSQSEHTTILKQPRVGPDPPSAGPLGSVNFWLSKALQCSVLTQHHHSTTPALHEHHTSTLCIPSTAVAPCETVQHHHPSTLCTTSITLHTTSTIVAPQQCLVKQSSATSPPCAQPEPRKPAGRTLSSLFYSTLEWKPGLQTLWLFWKFILDSVL